MNNIVFKKIGFSILVFLISNSIFSQGIEFYHGTWKETVAKAKAEKKLIFIDVYTDWCGPCKVLARDIFPQKIVGDFYNKNFVSFKLNAEKGKGIELAKKYSVAAYPTLLYISPEKEDVMHRSVALVKADELINIGKIALDPKQRVNALELEFNKGNRKDAFMKEYFVSLKKQRASTDYALGVYLSDFSKERLLTKETYDLLMEYASDIRGKGFNILIDNFKVYAEIAGGEYAMVKKLSRAYLLSHSHHVGPESAPKYVDNTVLDYLKQTNYPYKEQLLQKMKINYLGNSRKGDETVVETLSYLETFNITDIDEIIELIKSAAFQIKDPALAKKVVKNKTTAIALSKEDAYTYKVYATIYDVAGDYKKSLELFEKSLELEDKIEDRSFQKSYTLLGMMNVYKKTGEIKKGLEAGERALKLLENEKNVEMFQSRIKSAIEDLKKG